MFIKIIAKVVRNAALFFLLVAGTIAIATLWWSSGSAEETVNDTQLIPRINVCLSGDTYILPTTAGNMYSCDGVQWEYPIMIERGPYEN